MNEKQIKESYQTLVKFLDLNPGKPQNEQRFAQLPPKEILILLKDVCEEAERRLKDSAPFLLIQTELSPKRNQTRQKLATLSVESFSGLVSSLVLDIRQRYPYVTIDNEQVISKLGSSQGSSNLKYSGQAEIDRLKATYEHRLQVAETHRKENQELISKIDKLEGLVRAGERENQKLTQDLALAQSLLESTKANLEEADIKINQDQVTIHILTERQQESAQRIKNLTEIQQLQNTEYQQLQAKLNSLEQELLKKSVEIQALKLPKVSIQHSASSKVGYGKETSPVSVRRLSKMYSPTSPSNLQKTYISNLKHVDSTDFQSVSAQIQEMTNLGYSAKGKSNISFISSTFGFQSNNANVKACETSGMSVVEATSKPEKILDTLKVFLKNCDVLTRECTEFEQSFQSTQDERESMLDMQDLLARSLSKLMDLCKSLSKGTKDINLVDDVKDEVDRSLFTISCMGQMLRNKKADDDQTVITTATLDTPSDTPYQEDYHVQVGKILTTLVIKMQNGDDDDEVCPTIDSILEITNKVRIEARAILGTNQDISDELYDETDCLVAKLIDKENELTDLRECFLENTSTRSTRQDLTDNVYDMTKILNDIEACLASIYINADEE